MKKSFLFTLFALFALAPVFSQEKSFEYGFSLKGGTYTTTKSGEMKYRYVPTTMTYRPGYSAAAGMYAKFRLGRWMALSSELMLGFAEFKVETKASWLTELPEPYPVLIFQSLTETARYSARNVFLPIYLHVGRGLRPKFSGYLGAAPVYNWGTAITYSYDYSEREDDQETSWREWEFYREPGWKDPRWQWLLSAGAECRLGAHYALGLQVLFNTQNLNTSGEFEYSPQQYPVPMKSVTATLRHNL